MKYFKMLLYKDKPSANITPDHGEPPGDWPAFLNPLKEGEEVVAPWTKVTEEEYHAYRANLRPQYDVWTKVFNDPKEAKITRLYHKCRVMEKELRLYADHEANGLTVPAHILQMREDCATLEAEQERLNKLEVGGVI